MVDKEFELKIPEEQIVSFENNHHFIGKTMSISTLPLAQEIFKFTKPSKPLPVNKEDTLKPKESDMIHQTPPLSEVFKFTKSI